MTDKKKKVEVSVKFGSLLFPALTVLFAAVKLFGIYPMSWLWVFSPLWVPLAITLGVFLVGALGILGFLAIVGLVGLAFGAYEKWKRNKRT